MRPGDLGKGFAATPYESPAEAAAPPSSLSLVAITVYTFELVKGT